MTTNKKKLLITESLSEQGWKLFKDRGDIEAIEFPNMIPQKDFVALLAEHAPVHGVALGATAFGDNELDASQAELDHAVDGVDTATADAHYLDHREVVLV